MNFFSKKTRNKKNRNKKTRNKKIKIGGAAYNPYAIRDKSNDIAVAWGNAGGGWDYSNDGNTYYLYHPNNIDKGIRGMYHIHIGPGRDNNGFVRITERNGKHVIHNYLSGGNDAYNLDDMSASDWANKIWEESGYSAYEK